MTRYLVYSAVGFVMGGLLFSYYIPKWLKHIDIREKSKDHNPGTANAFMLAGSTVGTLCLICDLMKGLVPVAAAAQRLDVTNLAFAALIDRQASEAVELLREAKSLFEAAGSPEMAQGCEDLLSKLEAKQ